MNDDLVILQLNEVESVALEGVLLAIDSSDGLGDNLQSVLTKLSQQLDEIQEEGEE